MDKNKDGFITKGELKLAKKNIGMKVAIHISFIQSEIWVNAMYSKLSRSLFEKSIDWLILFLMNRILKR